MSDEAKTEETTTDTTAAAAQELAEQPVSAPVEVAPAKADPPKALPAPEREAVNAQLMALFKEADDILKLQPGERFARVRNKLAETMGAIR